METEIDKFSCNGEVARHNMSLEILLSYSMSFEIT